MSLEWAPPELRAQLLAGEVDDLEDLRSVDPNAALLRELSMVQELIATLPSDDFASRYRLETRADEVRAALHEATADELEAAADEWSERAGRKGEHEEVDPEVAKSMLNKFMDGGFS
ncbi:MAG: hypothetical protein AAF081_06875 [Actinomycetota bacterium]